MIAILLAVSLALLPVYSFASGGMQFSHMALALFMAVRLIQQRTLLRTDEVMIIGLVVLILLRESYALLVEGVSITSLLEVLYVLFAAAMLITASRLPLGRPEVVRAVITGLGLAAAVALGGIWYYGVSWSVDEGELVRSLGTFNNPNQVAYFSVCLLSLASLLYLRNQITSPGYLAFLAAALILSVAALSKAGLVAVAGSAMIAIAAVITHKRVSVKLVVACALAAGLVAQLYAIGLFDDFYFAQRLEGIGADSDDNAARRGYFLPGEGNVFALLFGIGQGGLIELLGREVHSTFWSFLVKYGLFGFALFMLFFYQWAKRVNAEFGVVGMFLIVVPVSLYGLTHNGARFAIFWLLIGLSFNSVRAPRMRPMATRSGPQEKPAFHQS